MNATPSSSMPACARSCSSPSRLPAAPPAGEPGDLLTSRAQIASALGFRAWRDSRIKDLIASGCPIFRLPGYRRGGWRADPRALSLWMKRLKDAGPAELTAQAETASLRAHSPEEPCSPAQHPAPQGLALSA